MQRTTRPANATIDSVEIVALVHWPVSRPEATPELLLEIGYRPAISSFIIEFPAGLIDYPHESPADAAVRELAEETGYVGRVTMTRDIVFQYNPALVDEAGVAVHMSINGDDAQNQESERASRKNLGEDEFIDIIRVPLVGLRARLERYQKEFGLQVDGRVYSLALGLEMMHDIKQLL